jgi:hypothetical protein
LALLTAFLANFKALTALTTFGPPRAGTASDPSSNAEIETAPISAPVLPRKM